MSTGKKRKRKNSIGSALLKSMAMCIIGTLLGFTIAMIIYIAVDYIENRGQSSETIELVDVEIIKNNKNIGQYLNCATQEDEEGEEEPEDFICFESELYIGTCTPTSISLEWADAELGNYEVLYRPVDNAKENHGKSAREDNSESMSSICSAINENSDTGEESEGNGWLKHETSENKVILEGLTPDTEYHIHIIYADKSLGTYDDVFEARTAKNGYCDPFRAVYAHLRISERDENSGVILSRGAVSSVQMTSDMGCEGVVVKPMFDTDIFNRAKGDDRRNEGQIPKGTKLRISPDEGNNYCYYDGGGYLIHVQSADKKYDGWIDSRAVLIDMNKLFTISAAYSMQFDRTNAYSSIFTSGGDAQYVVEDQEALDERLVQIEEEKANADVQEELTEVVEASAEEAQQQTEVITDSRYSPLVANVEKQEYLTETGINKLEGITGEKLPNYESKEYMPVVWDLAMELMQCQKNALENGYTIKMYEGYRPMSTSHLVYNTLSGSGILDLNVNGTTFAQGYITSTAYNTGNYIAYRSRHNMGIATDLSIVRVNSPTELGEDALMQTKMHTLDFRCNMAYNTWEADLLTDIMVGHGSNLAYLGLRQEWWHFQLKTNRTDLYPLIGSYSFEDFEF